MRIPGVLRRRDVRLRVAHEPRVAEPSGHQLLNVVLSRRHAVAQPARHRVERAIFDVIEDVRCLPVRRHLVRVPDRREPLHEIARRHHVHTGLAHELDCAGVYPGNVWNRAVCRVFHRDAPHAAEQAVQPGFQLIAAGVALGRTGQVRERIFLDRVDQGSRLAGGGNQVIPPPRRQVAPLAGDRGHVGGDRIQAAKVVEQPAVKAVRRECRLHGGDVQRGVHLGRGPPGYLRRDHLDQYSRDAIIERE